MKPLKPAEFRFWKTVGGGGSGESRKSAEGARSVFGSNLSGKRTGCYQSHFSQNVLHGITFLFGATEDVSVVFSFLFYEAVGMAARRFYGIFAKNR